MREAAAWIDEGAAPGSETLDEAPGGSRPDETEKGEAAATEPAKTPRYRTPQVGIITRGIVSGVKPYGLFLDLPELGSRTRGLLHQSEFQSSSGSAALKGVKEGDTPEVQIVRIDDQGKISLSQKSIFEQQEASDLKQYPGQSAGPGKLGTMADLFKKK